MTALNIARREMPLDDLVVRVYHMELNECRDEAEFREGVRLVLRNLDEVLDALCFYRPPEQENSKSGGPREAESVPYAQPLYGRTGIF